MAAGPNPTPAPRRFRATLWRQVMVLGLVCCAVGLVLAFPLRSYLAERAELQDQAVAEQQMQTQLDELTERKAALTNPAYIRAEARRRLQYVQPGDTVYVVQAPVQTFPGGDSSGSAKQSAEWYARLWDTVSRPGSDSR